MDKKLLIKLKEMLVAEEGNYNHMYCDTTGNVTIGVGHLIANAEEAVKLPFRFGNRRANDLEIKEEYMRIRQLGKNYSNYKANWYGRYTNLYLEDEDITKIFEADITRIVKSLIYQLKSKKDIDFNKQPNEVKLALLDMAYNLGVNGLISKFPRFMKAIKEEDYELAARESRRIGVPDRRNKAVKDLLLKA